MLVARAYRRVMPSLVAISGPLRGATFSTDEEALNVGRDESNQVVVDDLAASRRHCVIRKDGERFNIVDLQSRNGTFVNGLPISERLLEHGDQVRIGTSVFLFLDVRGPKDSDSVAFDEGLLIARSTAILRREDSIYLTPANRNETDALSERPARDLKVLFRIIEAVHTASGLEIMLRGLLKAVFEIVPVDRGAVLLTGPSGELTPAFSLDRRQGESSQVRVSSRAVEKVIRERVAVVDERVAEAGRPPLWMMAVPLVCIDRAIGALCLETSSPEVGRQLDKDLLQLFAAIGAVTGLAIEDAKHVAQLEVENFRLQAEINIEHNMIGESPAMQEVYRFIGKVAPTGATVLLQGESGTGKELAARAIHRNSPRSSRPFVAINCAALTETLLESELFGHEKGAFTGAVVLKRGKLEMADGGTVFLDEIGELAPALQAKLLRVLQEHEFERVGGTKSIPVNVRVIAATNRDLLAASKSGAFRQDLYFRLNVVALSMPSLRNRRQDVGPLAAYFILKAAERSKRKVTGISAKARELLMQYDWPGNVRELENAIERAVILGTSEMILPEDLPESLHESVPIPAAPSGKLQSVVQEAKKRAIRAALEQAAWNYTEAAKLLDVHPNYLHRLIQNMNLKTELKRLAQEHPGVSAR
jgi:two-component system, NtrC family, response regulator HydG